MKNVVLFSWLSIAAVAGHAPVRGDVVTDWNAALLQAIKNESTSPPLSARNLAIVHAAVFDAVNAIERGYDPYLFSPNPAAGASVDAAAIGAAHECLIRLYPSQTALFETVLQQTLASIPAGSSRDEGMVLGQLVALLTLAWRSSDGSSTTVPYIPGTEPGDWRRTPPFFRPPELPHWPYVVPFALTNSVQFRPVGPPSLTSAQYTRDFNLVKELGALNSASRTAEQTLIARFWSDFSFTVTPPGHWNQIAQNVATNHANSVTQNARLFALLNIAMADAGIACWNAKYAWNFWRPVTAIREGDVDGNPDTEGNADWTPLLNTPPFPEYMSGHSTFSAAAAMVLASFFGTDRVQFTVGSDTLPGVLRSYESFAAAADEIGMSRIYGGIHFLSADLDGLSTGHQIGEYVFDNFLRPRAGTLLVEVVRNSGNAPPQIRISVSATTETTCVLESSDDLIHWTPIHTNTAPFSFSETGWSNTPERFYRAAATNGEH